MKKTESIKEYFDRLLNIASRVRLLGSSLPKSRIVEKILVTVPEKFEATITSLENIKDMSKITLAELLNALLAQEQRRAMRREDDVEGALSIKHQENARNNKKKKGKKHQGSNEEFMANNNWSKAGNRKSHPSCQHCGRKSHPHFKCWRRPNAKCTKCNQMGHETIICKNKFQQHGEDAQIADQGRRINCSWLHVSLALDQVRVGLLTVVVLTT